MFCVLLFNLVYFVILLLCMFCSVYSVSLCCSVYCLCVNVYCSTAATGCGNPIAVNKVPYQMIFYLRVFQQNVYRILGAPSGAAENSVLLDVTLFCWRVISNVLSDRSASIFRVKHSNLNYPATAWETTRPTTLRHTPEDSDLFHARHMSCPFHHVWLDHPNDVFSGQ
jgi:hypothetical protein